MTQHTRESPFPHPIDGRLVMAEVVALLPPGGGARVQVRRCAAGPRDLEIARVAAISGYRPAVGDRVAVARITEDEVESLLVVAAVDPVLPAESPELALADGTCARRRGDALEIADREGRILVRYREGSAEVHAPARDLRLVAPKGRVCLEAGTDVQVSAARDIAHAAGRSLDLQAAAGRERVSMTLEGTVLDGSRVELRSRIARLAAVRLDMLAHTVTTTAERLIETVHNRELEANTIRERATDVFREATGLVAERFGRVRKRVKETYRLESRRSVMLSEGDTTINGERILLG